MSLTRGGNKTLADDEISNTPCTFHTMEQHMNHAQNSEWHAPNHFNQVMSNSQLFPLQRCKERWSTTKLELASDVCKNKICEQNPTETWILSLHGTQRLWKKQTTKSFSTEMHHSTLSLCFGTAVWPLCLLIFALASLDKHGTNYCPNLFLILHRLFLECPQMESIICSWSEFFSIEGGIWTPQAKDKATRRLKEPIQDTSPDLKEHTRVSREDAAY
jgi:hypothetical protein